MVISKDYTAPCTVGSRQAFKAAVDNKICEKDGKPPVLGQQNYYIFFIINLFSYTVFILKWFFLEEDEQEAINWLHHNDAPQSMVLEKMKKTAHARYKWLRQLPRPSTAEIFEKYPRLLDSGVVSWNCSSFFKKKHHWSHKLTLSCMWVPSMCTYFAEPRFFLFFFIN